LPVKAMRFLGARVWVGLFWSHQSHRSYRSYRAYPARPLAQPACFPPPLISFSCNIFRALLLKRVYE
jgi:hypothetical protein